MNVDYNTCHVFKYLIVCWSSHQSEPFKDSEWNIIFSLQYIVKCLGLNRLMSVTSNFMLILHSFLTLLFVSSAYSPSSQTIKISNIFIFDIEDLKTQMLVSITCESESHSVVPDSLWSHGLYSPWNSLGQNTGVGSLSLLQGIFPNPGVEPRSPTLQADSLLAEP